MTATPTRPPEALGGVLLALVGVACLSINDVAVKFLSGGYALHEVILFRALVGMVVVLATMALARQPLASLRTHRPVAQGIRVLCILFSNASYFLGLSVLPLADAVATSYVAPLLMTGLSVVALGERVGFTRWVAVLAGLAGVLVMVQPGTSAFQPAALLVLFGALCYALAQIMTRYLAATETSFSLSFHTQSGFILLCIAMGLGVGDGHLAGSGQGAMAFLLRPWIWPPLADWPAFLAAGCAVAIGGLAMSQAYRISETALVAPFEYLGMPLAIFWGALVFSQWPGQASWIGMALICGAGLVTMAAERSRRKGM